MSLALTNNDAPTMQSYPSPTAMAADSTGPFYNSNQQHQQNQQHAQQQRLPNADDLRGDEMQLLAQLSRGTAPAMASSALNTQDPALAHQSNGFPQEHMHQLNRANLERAGPSPSPGQGQDIAYNDSSTPARKRSKVSRACDECRRKKVWTWECCDFRRSPD